MQTVPLALPTYLRIQSEKGSNTKAAKTRDIFRHKKAEKSNEDEPKFSTCDCVNFLLSLSLPLFLTQREEKRQRPRLGQLCYKDDELLWDRCNQIYNRNSQTREPMSHTNFREA